MKNVSGLTRRRYDPWNHDVLTVITLPKNRQVKYRLSRVELARIVFMVLGHLVEITDSFALPGVVMLTALRLPSQRDMVRNRLGAVAVTVQSMC